jgi:hypothetical protein
MYGDTIPASEYRPQRDLIAPPERTPAGNLAIRIGRELPNGNGWQQVAYVVLTDEERRTLAGALGEA